MGLSWRFQAIASFHDLFTAMVNFHAVASEGFYATPFLSPPIRRPELVAVGLEWGWIGGSDGETSQERRFASHRH
jgi:hypothetical protein